MNTHLVSMDDEHRAVDRFVLSVAKVVWEVLIIISVKFQEFCPKLLNQVLCSVDFQ